MRQAIETKVIPATNHRGTRVKAICAARSLTVNWNYGIGSQANHELAAYCLAAKLEWTSLKLTTKCFGTLKNGNLVHAVVSK